MSASSNIENCGRHKYKNRQLYSEYSCNKTCKDGKLSVKQRKWDAKRQCEMRKSTARYQQKQLFQGPRTLNCDERNIPYFIAMFSKSLPHDEKGIVKQTAYKIMQQGIIKRNIKLLTNVPQPGNLKLVNPLAAFTINNVGPSASSISMPPPSSMSSKESASEMVELYWQALLRDVPLTDFKNNNLVKQAIESLSKLKDYKVPKPITAKTIFIGFGVGELKGPYISQLMYIDTPIWPGICKAKYFLLIRGLLNNRMITKETYLNVQNGFVTDKPLEISDTKTYITTGRDLDYAVLSDLPS